MGNFQDKHGVGNFLVYSFGYVLFFDILSRIRDTRFGRQDVTSPKVARLYQDSFLENLPAKKFFK